MVRKYNAVRQYEAIKQNVLDICQSIAERHAIQSTDKDSLNILQLALNELSKYEDMLTFTKDKYCLRYLGLNKWQFKSQFEFDVTITTDMVIALQEYLNNLTDLGDED